MVWRCLLQQPADEALECWWWCRLLLLLLCAEMENHARCLDTGDGDQRRDDGDCGMEWDQWVILCRYRTGNGPDLDIFLICRNVISKVTWFCRVANVSRNKKLEWHNLHISNLNIRLCTSQSARLGHHHVSRTLKGNLTVALTWSSEKNHALQ